MSCEMKMTQWPLARTSSMTSNSFSRPSWDRAVVVSSTTRILGSNHVDFRISIILRSSKL